MVRMSVPRSSTRLYRNTSAFIAWFCVLAATFASSARCVRKPFTSRAPAASSSSRERIRWNLT